jgi:hypothetical protein
MNLPFTLIIILFRGVVLQVFAFDLSWDINKITFQSSEDKSIYDPKGAKTQ